MRQSTIEAAIKKVVSDGFMFRKDEQAGDTVMAILCDEGDFKIIFDPTRREEVEEAKKTFANFKQKGWLAFKVEGEEGRKGELMREFDEKAGRVIMTPPMAGGC